ncbi:hypothetical protein [Actinotignum urinale]|uniref:hypothetical protein n=1 Tax=Actinotignum urinale TaxID=190146 RepID=UPI00280A5CB3|nr:hypothetical protein [Actinotignum urinale]
MAETLISARLAWQKLPTPCGGSGGNINYCTMAAVGSEISIVAPGSLIKAFKA